MEYLEINQRSSGSRVLTLLAVPMYRTERTRRILLEDNEAILDLSQKASDALNELGLQAGQRFRITWDKKRFGFVDCKFEALPEFMSISLDSWYQFYDCLRESISRYNAHLNHDDFTWTASIDGQECYYLSYRYWGHTQIVFKLSCERPNAVITCPNTPDYRISKLIYGDLVRQADEFAQRFYFDMVEFEQWHVDRPRATTCRVPVRELANWKKEGF